MEKRKNIDMGEQKIKFTIIGKPVPKPRMTRRDIWLNPPRPCVARYRQWRTVVINAYLQKVKGVKRFKGNLAMGFKFYSSSERADLDNLIKAIKDSLQGWAYENDRQVRRYIGDPEIIPCKNGKERAEIVLEEVNG